jgi:Domain of unknown function (DUF4258)
MNPTGNTISQVRALVESGKFKITQHAAQEMAEEEIALDDLLHTISNARLLEDYPDHRRGACCLLQGTDARSRHIHTVCTTANPTLIIITAYLPKPPKWISPTQRRNRP